MVATLTQPPLGAPAAGLSLAEALDLRGKAGKPVRVGLIGAGQMGTDIVVQISQMQGIEIAAVADIAPDRVSEAAALAGRKGEVDSVSDEAGLDATRRRGRIAATASLDLICRSPSVDVIIDATGNPEAGSRVALTAIAAHDHRTGLASATPLAECLRLADGLAVLDEAAGREATVAALRSGAMKGIVGSRPFLVAIIAGTAARQGLDLARLGVILAALPRQTLPGPFVL